VLIWAGKTLNVRYLFIKPQTEGSSEVVFCLRQSPQTM
jgi:hypothetical protein